VDLLYRASMRRVSGDQVGWSRNWSRLDERQLSLHGHRLIWDAPPSSDSDGIVLDGAAKKLLDTKEYSVQLRVDCQGEQPCAADGDTIETVITVTTIRQPRALATCSQRCAY
jgi:hypothetical protein